MRFGVEKAGKGTILLVDDLDLALEVWASTCLPYDIVRSESYAHDRYLLSFIINHGHLL